MQNSFSRSKVLVLAHQLVKSAGLNFGEAQNKAWRVFKLKAEMREKHVEFTYFKKDGTRRIAMGTLQVRINSNTVKRNYSPLYIRYYDVEKNGWRQFAAAKIV